MMDARITPSRRRLRRRRLSARRRSRAARRARRARRAGVADQVEAVRDIAQQHDARSTRVAADEPNGRCSGRAASRRSARSRASRPTTTCTTRSCRARASSRCCGACYEIADAHRLITMNVFHAGDGNLHPLIVFDGREPGVWDRVHHAGNEILETCIAAGGVLTGEHGVGIEKRDLMPLLFSPDDLDAQARLRDAFDPDGAANPLEGAAARQPVRRAATGPGGHVDLSGVPARRWRRRRAVVASRRAHAVGGRQRGRAGRRGRGTGGRASRYEPEDLTVTVGAGTSFADARRDARRARTGVPARPARRDATIGGLLACGLSGRPPPPARAAPRPRARGALRHRRRARRQGRRTDGEERHRLRPAAAARRLARHARRARAGDAALPSPRRVARSGSGPTEPPRDLFRPAAVLWDGHDVHVLLEGVAGRRRRARAGR